MDEAGVDEAAQLAAAVSVARGLTEAIGSGATPSDGTPHGQVIREALAAGVGDLGPEALDELRDRLIRDGDPVRATLELTKPVARLLGSDQPLPAALDGLRRAATDLNGVSREVLAAAAARRATAAVDEATALAWCRSPATPVIPWPPSIRTPRRPGGT